MGDCLSAIMPRRRAPRGVEGGGVLDGDGGGDAVVGEDGGGGALGEEGAAGLDELDELGEALDAHAAADVVGGVFDAEVGGEGGFFVGGWGRDRIWGCR